jgi:arabinofuranan 3-O-arabinosyltransferase
LTVEAIEPRTTVDRRYAETTVLPVAIKEIQAPSIAAPVTTVAQSDCRSDLVDIDGVPLSISVDQSAIGRLLEGEAVEVEPCASPAVALGPGTHRLTTSAGLSTGIDVDRIVLEDTAVGATPPPATPAVTVQRTRTSRTATVTNCPTGCWLILGEGFNDGWEASTAGNSLGAPRPISGGFNGWFLPGSSEPVTVTMEWAPQGTMWIGMALAALAVLGCAALVWRDKARAEVPVPPPPVPYWPPTAVGRRPALIAAGALVVLTALTISPKYAVLAAVIGFAVVVLRRPIVAGVASVALVAALAAVILRRQIRYRLVANPSWPAAFDDLHRLGLLVVVLLLASTLVDDCPGDEPEQVA